MSGRGAIYSYAVPHPPLLPQFSDLAPYNVILVTLDEDPTIRLIGNLVNRADDPINAVDPGSIEMDHPVRGGLREGQRRDPHAALGAGLRVVTAVDTPGARQASSS